METLGSNSADTASQLVSVQLKDGRHFEPGGCKRRLHHRGSGISDVPFAPEEVEHVAVNHESWNFRESSDLCRYREKSRAATA
jgi:hypothetical protein